MGNSDAQNLLGLAYAEGDGVEKNLNEAERYYEMAIAQGNTAAMHNRANIYFDLSGKGNRLQAVNFYYEAAKAGSVSSFEMLENITKETERYNYHMAASDFLGDLMIETSDGERSALSFYHQNFDKYLAPQRSIKSIANHATLLSSDLYFNIPDRYEHAQLMLERVSNCQQGEAFCNSDLKGKALYSNALLHFANRLKLSAEESNKKAHDYLVLAASHGHIQANLDLGALYLAGDLVTKDYTKARVFYESAIDLGSSEASEALASLERIVEAEEEERRLALIEAERLRLQQEQIARAAQQAAEAERLRLAEEAEAERLRLANEEQERQRFLASPEGQRQLAEARKTEPWYTINVGKMAKDYEEDKSAFLLWWVENHDHYNSSCKDEADLSADIQYRKDPTNYGANENPETTIVENELMDDVPVDVTLNWRNQVTGASTYSYLNMRYVRGQSFCKEILQSLVQPYATAIQVELDKVKLEADRYR